MVHRQHTSLRTDRRGRAASVVLAVTALGLVAAVLAVTTVAPVAAPTAAQDDAPTAAQDDAPAAAQDDGPTVRVVGEAVETDGTAAVRVVLTAAPEGLSGYALELSVENPDVARVEGAAYPDGFGLTTGPEVGADGRTVALEAVDLDGNVEPGASNVTLATVEIAGETAGETAVQADRVRLDDDSGDPLDPAIQSGTVAVSGGGGEGTEAGDSEGGPTGDDENSPPTGDDDDEGSPAAGESTPTASDQGDGDGDDDGDGDGERDEESSATGETGDDTSGASGALPLYVPVAAIGVVALAAVLLGRRP